MCDSINVSLFSEIIMVAYKSIQNRITEKVLWVLIILSPIIILLMQSAISRQNLFLGVPEWSDELDYWREMYSFSANGFSFGGSMFFGYDAKLGPMGAHSITPIAAWGPFFWLFRMNIGIHAIVWTNIFYLMLAWTIFVFLLKPDVIKSTAAALMAYFYPLTILYLHSSMLEIVCMAGIIIYFSLLYKYHISEKRTNLQFVLLLLIGSWCTFLRPTYIVLLFPAIWMKNKFKINLKTILSMLAYVIAFGIFYKVYGMFCADYPGWITSKLTNMVGIRNKLFFLGSNAKNNLIHYFSPKSADLCQVGLRYFYLTITVFTLIISFKKNNATSNEEKLTSKNYSDKISNNNTNKISKKLTINRMNLSLFILMFGLWFMMIVLYDIIEWRDFRAFAPICFGVVLFFFTEERSKVNLRILAAACAVHLLMYSLSGVNFIDTKTYPIFTDLSSYFSELELTDGAGRPRTIAVDYELNWLDISIMSSVPSKLGYQVFYYESNENDYIKADYIFIPEGKTTESGEFVTNIPGYGNVFKMYK